MQKFTVLKLIGLALMTMITLIIISFLEVAIYSYLINPGQAVSVYEAHAEVSAPYISGIFGLIIFFLVARYWTKKGFQNVPKLIVLYPVIYVLLDIGVLLLAGMTTWSDFILTFFIANTAKFLGCYLGYKLNNDNQILSLLSENS